MLNRSAYYKQHAFDSKLGSKSKSKHPRYILSSLHSSFSNWKQDRRNRNDWNHFQSIQLQFLPLLSVKFAAVVSRYRAKGVPGCWNRVHWPTLPQPARDQASANATHPFPPFHSPSFSPFHRLSRHFSRPPPAFLEPSSDPSFRFGQTPLFKRKDPAFFRLPSSFTLTLLLTRGNVLIIRETRGILLWMTRNVRDGVGENACFGGRSSYV